MKYSMYIYSYFEIFYMKRLLKRNVLYVIQKKSIILYIIKLSTFFHFIFLTLKIVRINDLYIFVYLYINTLHKY